MNTIFFLKKRGKFTLLFILLSPLCLVSFYYENSEPPTECQQSLSYDMEEFRFYVIQDQSELQNLTELDKVKLKRTRLNRHFEICTDMAGEVTTEITVLNPEEVYEEWMTKTTKTVVNKDKVSMYNANGELVFQRDRSDTSKVFYNATKTAINEHGLGIVPLFQPLSSSDIYELESQGYSIVQQSELTIISKENTSIYYNTGNLLFEIRELENGETIKTTVNKYKHDEWGQIVPDFFARKTKETLYSGVCVEQVLIRKYSNYVNSARIGERSLNDNQAVTDGSKIFSVFPNPSTAQLYVQIPGMLDQTPNASVKVIDAYGMVKLTLLNQQPGIVSQISLKELDPGVYFIMAEHDGKSYSERFVKY